jgi:hypothetical protein
VVGCGGESCELRSFLGVKHVGSVDYSTKVRKAIGPLPASARTLLARLRRID